MTRDQAAAALESEIDACRVDPARDRGNLAELADRFALTMNPRSLRDQNLENEAIAMRAGVAYRAMPAHLWAWDE